MERHKRVSVSGFLTRDGRALIVRRSHVEEQLPGYFELPGGKVEFGDDPARTIEREFLEETGLTAKAIGPYHVLSYVHPANTHRFDIIYLMKSDDTSPVVLSDEHDEHAWVTATKLDEPIASGRILMTEEMHAIITAGFSEPNR